MRMCYRLHKWLAVSVGLVVLVWFISGIVMILPPFFSRSPGRQAPVDFREITLSPAKAVQTLQEILGTPIHPNSVSLGQVHHVPVYKITLPSGDSFLMDAKTGEQLTITTDLAKRLALDDFPAQAPIRNVSRLSEHDFSYPWGPLPVYRVAFEDPRGTVSYVSISDGRVQRTDRWSRLRARVTHLHTFHTFVIDREKLRKSLLLLLSTLGIAAVGTGYYLVLPHRR